MAGCFKRQTGPRVVYLQPVPPPPGAAASPPPAQQGAAPASANAGGTLVIAEPPPPPPPPVEVAAPVVTLPAPVPSRRPRSRTDPHDAPDSSPADDAAAPAQSAEAPPLEPVTETASESVVRGQLQKLTAEFDHLQHDFGLSATDRRTLEDARTFVQQAQRALAGHDALRANQLAKKAALLLAAVEPPR